MDTQKQEVIRRCIVIEGDLYELMDLVKNDAEIATICRELHESVAKIYEGNS